MAVNRWAGSPPQRRQHGPCRYQSTACALATQVRTRPGVRNRLALRTLPPEPAAERHHQETPPTALSTRLSSPQREQMTRCLYGSRSCWSVTSIATPYSRRQPDGSCRPCRRTPQSRPSQGPSGRSVGHSSTSGSGNRPAGGRQGMAGAGGRSSRPSPTELSGRRVPVGPSVAA